MGKVTNILLPQLPHFTSLASELEALRDHQEQFLPMPHWRLARLSCPQHLMHCEDPIPFPNLQPLPLQQVYI